MRIRITAVALLACLLLSACSTTNTSNGDGYVAQACGGILACHDLNEYPNYLAQLGKLLPPDFVLWEDISHLGTFKGVGFYGYYDDYWYSIVDEADHSFMLKINHSPDLSATSTKICSVTDNMSDMYQISDDNPDAVIKRGSYEYRYSYGTLDYIAWYSNGVQFRLVGAFSKYPPDVKNTFISKLLSVDETVANAAFAEITSKLATK